MVCGVRGAVQYPRRVQSHETHSFFQGGFENLELGPEAGSSAACLGTVCVEAPLEYLQPCWVEVDPAISKLPMYISKLMWKRATWSPLQLVLFLLRFGVSHHSGEIMVQYGIDACRSTFCVVEPTPWTPHCCSSQLEKLPKAGVEFFLASEQLARSPKACAHSQHCTFVPAD